MAERLTNGQDNHKIVTIHDDSTDLNVIKPDNSSKEWIRGNPGEGFACVCWTDDSVVISQVHCNATYILSLIAYSTLYIQ